MPEEIEKTEEALQTATFKTKAVVEQLTKGDVKGVWEKLWDSLQGEIWHFGKIVLLAVVISLSPISSANSSTRRSTRSQKSMQWTCRLSASSIVLSPC